MNEEDQVVAWTIDSSSGMFDMDFHLRAQNRITLAYSVYNKLVTTALRYTPIVLAHHVPYKMLPSGKMYTISPLRVSFTYLHLTILYYQQAANANPKTQDAPEIDSILFS